METPHVLHGKAHNQFGYVAIVKESLDTNTGIFRPGKKRETKWVKAFQLIMNGEKIILVFMLSSFNGC